MGDDRIGVHLLEICPIVALFLVVEFKLVEAETYDKIEDYQRKVATEVDVGP
jgi:hypothetical protein